MYNVNIQSRGFEKLNRNFTTLRLKAHLLPETLKHGFILFLAADVFPLVGIMIQ